ncbi:MAG: NAD-dependent epimerase/dehydratase family protein [Chloroflexi bacterium]|nr:NAD-dependent epimerase/dehydratase family protein [Chloroflexota bacterium]
MPPRVLITGITGFAGSHLAERLVGRGDDVHGIAHERRPFPYLMRVAGSVTIHAADITDPVATRRAVDTARPEIVYHLAGQAVPTLATGDPLAAIRINVIGTGNVAEAVAAAGIHLVAASSADVYGIPDDPAPATEESPLRPTNVYAATKVAAESVLRAIGGRARVTILRPSNQIGPRQHPRLAASEFAKRIAEAEAHVAEPVIRHGQLDPRREFLDVRDMAAAYEAAGGIDDAEPTTYNVGSGTAVSVGAILDVLLGLAQVPIRTELDEDRVRPGVPSVLLLDSSRFRERTGWSPSIPLERSLSDTLDFWRSVMQVNCPPGAQTEARRTRSSTGAERGAVPRARTD